MPWPSQGSAAAEISGIGSLGSARGDAVAPIASLTKLVTALVVLQAHPLSSFAPGPAIPLTAADVATYNADLALKQSVLKVAAGETLTERQALEGLLIPSANNIAHVLARWDAGTTAAFVAKMNAMAASLGLAHTHFAGPSGYGPASVGTALDMVRLGADALANPTIASITAMGEVNLPVAGIVINFDYALGHDGIIGIKTGSAAGGGDFIFAARKVVAGHSLTVVGAVLSQGGPSPIDTALTAGEKLATAAFAQVRSFTVLAAGVTAVRVRAPWSSSAVVGRTVRAVQYFGLTGTEAKFHTVISPAIARGPTRKVHQGERLGTVTVSVGSTTSTVAVVASGGLAGPSLRWRLTRL